MRLNLDHLEKDRLLVSGSEELCPEGEQRRKLRQGQPCISPKELNVLGPVP